MKDIPIYEFCPHCGNHLTIMLSIRHPEGTTWLVKRCLSCGGIPVEELIQVIPEVK